MKIMDYFDRCYVISLPYRTDRRKIMREELERVGMPLQPGKVEIFDAIRYDDAGNFPNVGSRGCFYSHITILRRAKADGLNNVLIMEDDLTISKFFFENSERLISNLQETDWGFVFFGHVLWRKEPVVTAKPLRLEVYQGPLMTTHFYAINASILDRLLEYLELAVQRPPGHPEGGPMHVDGAYSMFRRQNPDILTLVARPSLGWQRSSRSDIYQNKWFDRLPLIKKMVALLRTFKVNLRGR